MATLFERLQRIQQGEEAHPPVCTLLGMTLQSVEVGRASFQMMIEDRHHNLLGGTHGGVYCDLADVAMGFAFASTLAEGEGFTTVELKINYLKPFRSGLLIAEARVLSHGRTLGLVECDIKDASAPTRLVAHATSTCMRLRETRRLDG